MKITAEEKNKVKRMQRTEDSLIDLWETNIRIVGKKKKKRKRKGIRKILNRS